MVTRQERVVLTLEDNFTSGMAKAAAAAALLHRQLDQLGNVNLNTSTSINQQLGQMSTNADQASNSINQLTGRLSLLADASLILGPGLIPIGSTGAEAIGGLVTAMSGLALAGGSAIVAFQGVGDAVKTVNAYTLEPTVANLEKAQEALAKIGPEAAGFVGAFQEFRPVLGDIRDAAAAGWFPGLSRSLDDFAQSAPKVEELFLRIGRAGGYIVEETAESFASERWAPFMQFLEDEVPGAMLSMSRSVGDLTHGAAELWRALDPGNDRFLGWVEDAANGFDRWASSASGREDITAFLDYARQNGPEVQAFFSSLVDATAQIVQAAAPLGGPTLTILTKVLDVVANIADSDLGTPFLTGLVALRLYSRTLLMVKAQQASLAATPIGGMVAPAVATGYGANYGTAIAGRLGGIAKGAGVAAGVGLLASGAAGDLGATNTALLTLAGTMSGAGPVGAALGALAGMSLDAAAANDSLTDSIERAGAALKTGDLTAGLVGIASAQQGLSDFKEDVNVGWFDFDVSPGQALGSLKNDIEGIVGASDVEEGTKAIGDLQAQATNTQAAVAGLGDAFGMWVAPIDGSVRSIDNLNNILERMRPAMERSGVDVEDLARAYDLQQKIANGTADWKDILAAGGSRTPFNDIVDGLERVNTKMHEAISLQDTFANSLAKAQGFLSRNGAIDAAYASWNQLKESVKQNGDAFDRMTVKGQANRAALRQMGAAIGTAAEKLHGLARTRFIDNMRGQFRESADLLNLNKTQTERWMRELGLLDKKKVKPRVELETDAFDLRAKRVLEQIGELKNSKTIDSKPTTLRVGMDLADFNAGKAKVLSSTDMLAKLNPTPKADLLTTQFFTGAAGVRSEVQRLDVLSPNIDVTITTTRVNRVQTIIDGKPSADGGSVPKTGLPYADRHPYLLADGEEIISNRHGQADAFRADRAAGRIPGYADGGTIGGGLSTGMALYGVGGEAAQVARGLKLMNAQLKESTSELEKERQGRQGAIAQTRDAFMSDPFAVSGDIWSSGAADPLSVLRNDIANATQFGKLTDKLGRNGLSGNALLEVDTLAEAQQLASMSPSELRQYDRLFGQRQRVTTQVGRSYADAAGFTVAEIRELRNDVKRVEKAIKQEHKQDRANRDKNHDKAKDQRREAARRARQRQQRNPQP